MFLILYNSKSHCNILKYFIYFCYSLYCTRKSLYVISRVPFRSPYAYKTAEYDGGIENRALVISSTCREEYKGGYIVSGSRYAVLQTDNKPRVTRTPKTGIILSVSSGEEILETTKPTENLFDMFSVLFNWIFSFALYVKQFFVT